MVWLTSNLEMAVKVGHNAHDDQRALADHARGRGPFLHGLLDEAKVPHVAGQLLGRWR